jgi:hypothetical protein
MKLFLSLVAAPLIVIRVLTVELADLRRLRRERSLERDLTIEIDPIDGSFHVRSD